MNQAFPNYLTLENTVPPIEKMHHWQTKDPQIKGSQQTLKRLFP